MSLSWTPCSWHERHRGGQRRRALRLAPYHGPLYVAGLEHAPAPCLRNSSGEPAALDAGSVCTKHRGGFAYTR